MKVLRIANGQKTRPLSIRFFRKVLVHILEQKLKLDSFELAIHLVDAKNMSLINQKYLNHEGSTDVITFDYREGYEHLSDSPLHGEIFISVDVATTQAAQFKTDWRTELVRYATHGFLHLLGFDDLQPAKRRVMKKRENGLMRQIEAEFDLRKLGR